MKQVNSNPTNNFSITLTTYAFTATGTNGTITATGISALEVGQSIILSITGGTAQGFTTLQEYFVIPVDATHIRLASTKHNALIGTNITTTGDAGAGTIYPNYAVGGTVYVGTGGDINIRGITNKNTGTTSFSLCKNVPDGSILPYMVKDVASYLTTASDVVVWCE